MFRPPTEKDIFAFVSTTHSIDRIPLTTTQIENTWRQKGTANPYAQGHFRAFMYIQNTLIPSSDFPAKSAQLLQNVGDSDNALFWLKTIHHKIADPLVGHELVADDTNAPSHFDIGRYRLNNTMGIMKPAPEASCIPALMHNWLLDYANLHEKIKDKVDNPYGLDKETALEVVKKTHEINLFFCAAKPLACLNQRMGRFLANTFRLAWRLPMMFYTPNSPEYRNLPQELQIYETETLPKLVSRIKNVR